MLSSVPRLRLAVLSYGLPKRAHKRGGIERAAHTLADGLARRGHDVVVFSHDPRPADAAYAVAPLPWRAFVDTWFGRRVTMGYLGNVLALVPDYREFDAIIAHGDSLLLPLVGKPVVRVMHGSALGEARSASSLGRRVLQLGVFAQELATALCSRGVVGVSENTRRDNPFVRRVIPHGVDERFFSGAGSDTSAQPSVLFVGTLDGRKRGRFLLDALPAARCGPPIPTATLDFVGPAGPPAPGVTYHTGITDEALAGLYRRAWVYASPSTYEGFGLPYLEAMACGTPVVASPNPGSAEVLDGGRCGVLATDDAFTTRSRRCSAMPAGAASWPGAGWPARASTRSRACSATTKSSCSSSQRSMPVRPPHRRPRLRGCGGRAPGPLACDAVGRADEDAATSGDRWGWVEVFLAIQLLWGAALFIPGAQAYRTPVRALPYLVSAAALVYYFRAPTGEPLHASAKWMLASFAAADAEPASCHHPLDGRRGADRLPGQHRRAHLLDGARRPHRWARDAHGVAAVRRELPQLRPRHPAGVLPRHVPAARVQHARARAQPRDRQLADLSRRRRPRDHPSARAERHAGRRRRVGDGHRHARAGAGVPPGPAGHVARPRASERRRSA